MNRNLQFIVNPRASNGRSGRIWRQQIEKRLKGREVNYEVHMTTAPGHASEIAAGLPAKAGAIISVGGDGTHGEVVSGLLKRRVAKKTPTLGCLTLGTGGDFRKTLKMPEDPIEQLEVLLADWNAKNFRPIDIGRLDYVDHLGKKATRGFINIASFGIGGEVDDRVNKTTKMFGGFASFLYGALRATLSYKNKTVRLKVDGADLGELRVFNVAVANGCFFGGGMHIAPEAKPNDGLFDVVILGDMQLGEKVLFAPKLYQGAHLEAAKVRMLRGRKIEADSAETVLLDVDGEQPGRLPAVFSIEPEAINLLGATRL